MSEWETFCDLCYYDLWRVRRKNERGFNDGYHIHNGEEAHALVELLNGLERERDSERALANRLAGVVEHYYADDDIAHHAGIADALAAWKEARSECR